MRIRQEVQMFDPLPSHLAYPDILGKFLRVVVYAFSTSVTVCV